MYYHDERCHYYESPRTKNFARIYCHTLESGHIGRWTTVVFGNPKLNNRIEFKNTPNAWGLAFDAVKKYCDPDTYTV